MVNTVQVNADHGRDFNPLADHMTKLKNLVIIASFQHFDFHFILCLNKQ